MVCFLLKYIIIYLYMIFFVTWWRCWTVWIISSCCWKLTTMIWSNPNTGLDRPWGFQEVEAPRIQDNWHEGGKVVSPMHQLPLPPRKYSWYSFLLEAESTPGP